MLQLIFDFIPEDYPDFDTFLGKANDELVHILQAQHEQFVYVWGAEGSGKSHLLRAWVSQAMMEGHSAFYIDVATTPVTERIFDASYVAIDQVEKLNAVEQNNLFILFNRYRNSGEGHLLCSSNVPPAKLSLREDLRTRLAYCLVYEVQSLSDEEKIDALANIASSRRLMIHRDVFQYLLNYWHRDIDSLVSILETIIEYSAITKKPITLPLVRDLLKQQDNL